MQVWTPVRIMMGVCKMTPAQETLLFQYQRESPRANQDMHTDQDALQSTGTPPAWPA